MAGSFSGLSIFMWFAALNLLIVAAAAIMKKSGAITGARKKNGRKRPEREASFTITNDTLEIGSLSDRIREFGEDHGLPVKTVFDLCLAAEELLSYVISNGFTEGQRASIKVRLRVEGTQALLSVEYPGRVLNPMEAPKIDITMPIEELPLDGWDIHLLRMLADDIGCERSGDKSIITLVQKWEAMEEAARQ